ncbi:MULTISPECIES: hypothetical protein [Pseudomonas]|uniref:hypothetical protein n=1 Tax=Pseudomonas TaxID=286 RepID=UPI0025A43001|nr:hypothetical protein [Pseudomonas asiatica]WJN50077.1 hypothetical protein QUR91_26175 [Pseudomonas asiatica]
MRTKRPRSEISLLIETSMPWSEVRADLLSPEDAATFRYRRDALEQYIEGQAIKDIKKSTGVSGNFLRKIIARCLAIAPDGMPFGYRALVPNFRTKNYVRSKEEFDPLAPKNAGMAGVLGQVFRRYPDLQETLNTYILKISRKDKKGSLEDELDKFNNRPKDVHKFFIDLLRGYGHPTEAWPFNTDNLGRRTITAYVKDLRENNIERYVRIGGDGAAKAHVSIGTGDTPLIHYDDFFDCWLVDSHTVDYISSIEIVNEEGVISSKPLTRLHVLLLYEPLARAAIWYRVVYGADVTANDVSALVREALSKELPKPRQVIPNLAPDPGAGFVTELYPELAQSPPSWIALDNAWAHHGDAVCYTLRKDIGCAYDYGPPKRFERRARIESRFDRFSAELAKRLRSTVGAGPGRGAATDAVGASVKYSISSDVLEHLTYVTFANSNIQTTEGLGNTTPKAAIAGFLAQRDGHFLPRTLPADKVEVIGRALVRVLVFVRGNLHKGIRPFINFERIRYRFENSAKAEHLIGEKIFIEVNESDIRGFNAFSLSGDPLGWMKAEGYWGDEAHSRKTRKAINSKLYQRIQEFVNGGNLLQVYKNSLISSQGKRGRGDNRKAAAELDRLKQEVSRATGEPPETPRYSKPDPPDPRLDENRPLEEAPPAMPSSGWVSPPHDFDIRGLLKKIR